MAVLHNAGGSLQFGDWFGPVHLHEDCIVARGIGPGCIENLFITHRLIALIGLSRCIVLAMISFTLVSSCLATLCSDSCSSSNANDILCGLRNCACSIARRHNS